MKLQAVADELRDNEYWTAMIHSPETNYVRFLVSHDGANCEYSDWFNTPEEAYDFLVDSSQPDWPSFLRRLDRLPGFRSIEIFSDGSGIINMVDRKQLFYDVYDTHEIEFLISKLETRCQ